jgi:hypothetical protein
MAHAQKPDLVFQGNGRVHWNRRGVSSVEYWQSRRADQRAAVVGLMLDRPCSEVEMEEHCLPTPFVCFPFTSPPVRHRVPSGSERTLMSDQGSSVGVKTPQRFGRLTNILFIYVKGTRFFSPPKSSEKVWSSTTSVKTGNGGAFPLRLERPRWEIKQLPPYSGEEWLELHFHSHVHRHNFALL